jgi:hypothetical protein
VTIENILDVRYSRNKQIVRTLARYKAPPNKDMGEGLNTAFQKMKDWKLKLPDHPRKRECRRRHDPTHAAGKAGGTGARVHPEARQDHEQTGPGTHRHQI